MQVGDLVRYRQGQRRENQNSFLVTSLKETDMGILVKVAKKDEDGNFRFPTVHIDWLELISECEKNN